MFFVKFFRFLTVCCALILLNACASAPPQSDFNRSEAVKARISLALAYLEQRDFPKAKENIDKALAHNSRDYLPHSVLAYYYQQLEQTESALKSYQTALTLSQDQPDVLNNYGTLLCKQLEFERAFQLFDQALQSPARYYHQADTLENIALCAKRAKRPAKISQALEQLHQLDVQRALNLRRTLSD